MDGGERLLATIEAACDPAADFPEQLRSTLAAALALLVSEPDLARLLCIEPYSGGALPMGPQQRWLKRCGGLLRRAARSCPRASRPLLFLELLLLDDICQQVSNCLLAGRREQLPGLLPDLLESILPYYLDLEETDRVVAAARNGGR